MTQLKAFYTSQEGTSNPLLTHDLLPSERTFLSAVQELGFGRLEELEVLNGQLVLDQTPAMVREVKFGSPVINGKTADAALELRPQIAEFFAYVRSVETGKIRLLEVRHGLPFAMEVDLPPGDWTSLNENPAGNCMEGGSRGRS